MKRFEMFFWGTFGAALPTIVDRYQRFSSGQPSPYAFGFDAVIIVVAFVIASGLFTVAWEPGTKFQAVWIGLSVPNLVAALLKAAPTLPIK